MVSVHSHFLMGEQSQHSVATITNFGVLMVLFFCDHWGPLGRIFRENSRSGWFEVVFLRIQGKRLNFLLLRNGLAVLVILWVSVYCKRGGVIGQAVSQFDEIVHIHSPSNVDGGRHVPVGVNSSLDEGTICRLLVELMCSLGPHQRAFLSVVGCVALQLVQFGQRVHFRDGHWF